MNCSFGEGSETLNVKCLVKVFLTAMVVVAGVDIL